MELRKPLRKLLPNGCEKYEISLNQRKESGDSKKKLNPRYILKVEEKYFSDFFSMFFLI